MLSLLRCIESISFMNREAYQREHEKNVTKADKHL